MTAEVIAPKKSLFTFSIFNSEFQIFIWLVQYLAAEKVILLLDPNLIENVYRINTADVNTSGLWYDVRTGL